MGNRLFAITDAVTETDSGPYQHQLAEDKYECNSVLGGSALIMQQAFKNLEVRPKGADIELLPYLDREAEGRRLLRTKTVVIIPRQTGHHED